ncbi:phosphatases II [Endogone sp. FLAS-F59071]|nr:phosphatases II [Endogone sp. FLAS-F59071]|eukprot:RUS21738.1 phosphatases II [Endogone sp. FLAS-F59071]
MHQQHNLAAMQSSNNPGQNGSPMGNERFKPLNNAIVLDWRYEMRREMQEILPGLFLGPYSVSKQLPLLQSVGITHVLCLLDRKESSILRVHYPEHLRYLSLEVSDSPFQNLIPYFPQAKSFIDEALHSGGKALVYCNGGISRSPAFVVAYVMETLSLDYDQAYQFVQNRRFCMNPNEAFKSQLKEYEPIYTARREVSHHPYTAEEVARQQQSRRRPAPVDDDEEEMMQEARRASRVV